MNNLGYLRPYTTCGLLKAGKVYPILSEHGNYYVLKNDTFVLMGHKEFDYLPPDNGFGWLKNINDPLGFYRAITSADGQRAALENVYGVWEYIPPYAEQVEKPVDTKSFPFNVKLSAPTEEEKQRFIESMRPTNEAAERDQPCAKSIGWAYAYACSLADKGIDIRKTECPAMFEQAEQDFGSSAKQSEIKPALNTLKSEMQSDTEYAWAWHCNIAMPAMDFLGVTHEQANKFAAKLMQHLFDIDTSQNEHYGYRAKCALTTANDAQERATKPNPLGKY